MDMEVRFRRCRLYYDVSWAAVTNGLETNELETNGLETNGLETNGLETNGLETNGLETNGLETQVHDDVSKDISVGQEHTGLSRQLGLSLNQLSFALLKATRILERPIEEGIRIVYTLVQP
jgi:hypothetical protein